MYIKVQIYYAFEEYGIVLIMLAVSIDNTCVEPYVI